MIQVENLVKTFGPLEAVKDVSFRVKEGELFGFLGPNGAGKTTTINILCTLLAPTRGKAVVAGYDVVEKPNAVRQSIGIIFQDPSLDERLTTIENLRFHAMLYHLPWRKTRDRVEMLLELVGLTERRGDLVKYFSGGMKRRLEIVRGLLHCPRVLFLDEPTLGLDPQTRNHIWTYVRELQKTEGITLFLTTHYMEEADQCDRIAIMDLGKIVALDTPAAFKQAIGNDTVTLETEDDEVIGKEISESYKAVVERGDQGLQVRLKNGNTLLPHLLARFGHRIRSVDIRRPTLDDVFLKLTGHEIREGNASDKDRLRNLHKKWVWRMR